MLDLLAGLFAQAKLLKLPGGSLSVGAPADITIFDPEATWTVNPDEFISKGKNTPFGGWSLTGKPTTTIVNGIRIYG